MKALFLTTLILSLTACTSSGTIKEANSNAVVVLDRAGNFGDSGSAVASEHCAKYGKVAVYYSGHGSPMARLSSYLCR